MKIINKNICKSLDVIQQEYSRLFDDLILLKNFNSFRFSTKLIFEFQYNLGLSLYNLSTIRNAIISEEKIIISKKNRLTKKWFISKMRLLKKYKDAIDNCITIGKSLGDAFIWHFYQFNPQEFFGNLDYEEIKIFPTGIGGLGELKFIKKYFILNNHFAILHGISNFLRIGDVSFISMKDLRLTSIGEIKTKRTEKGINVSLTAINAKGRSFIEQQQLKDIEVSDKEFYRDYFNPNRYKRQIERTEKYLSKHDNKTNKGDKIFYDKYHIQEFQDAIQLIGRKGFNIKRVNRNLLYVANTMSSKKFSRRMFTKNDVSKLKKHEAEIEKDIISILDKKNPNYPLRFGSVHFDKNLQTKISIGVPPLFWYPIKPKILKDIYFQNIFLLSIFNPTNFYSELKNLGIEFIKDEKTGRFFLGKKMEKGIMKFEYFSYFFSLIEDCLHTQEAVISIIKEIVSLGQAQKGYVKAKMQTEILHLFTAYNQDNLS